MCTASEDVESGGRGGPPLGRQGEWDRDVAAISGGGEDGSDVFYGVGWIAEVGEKEGLLRVVGGEWC